MTPTTKIQKDKIKSIADKLSTLIKVYASTNKLDDYIIQYFDILTTTQKNYKNIFKDKTRVLITKIDFKRFIKDSNEPETLKFVGNLSGLVSNAELEMLFIKKYYTDYLIILNILQMLLYNTPRQILKTDLRELNKLYKKYTKNDNT